MCRAVTSFLALVMLYSCQANSQTFTKHEYERFVAETSLAFHDGCLKGRIELYLELEKNGLILEEFDRAGLHYAAYRCGEMLEDHELIFNSGIVLIFDLNFWENRVDCRVIKHSARELNLSADFRERLENSEVYCVDEYMIVGDDS